MVRYGAPLAPVVSYEYEYAATVAPTLAPATQAATTYAETTAAVVPEEEVRSRAECAHSLRLASSYSREFAFFLLEIYLLQSHTAFPQHPHGNDKIMTLTKTLKLV